MQQSLAGTRVLVSGAAGGVGRAVVTKLVEGGAKVCATEVAPFV